MEDNLYYFLHPYISSKNSIDFNLKSCVKYVKALSYHNIKVFAPSLFLHYPYSEENIQEDYIRNIDGIIMDKSDGIIISPIYSNQIGLKNVRPIINYFKLSSKSIYFYTNIIKEIRKNNINNLKQMGGAQV